MKWGIKILPREVLLDTQGRAVQDYLNQSGQEVSQCRVGKYIVLDLKQTDKEASDKDASSKDASDKEAFKKEASKKKAIEITEQTLINPLIETYTIESL
ncbi:MAG: phosphoribosylformylglycinamidine synthase subunit PurS [Bdellovibrionaceae bacterium]|nr:phosphoribosylformylglycinamidine synthase subunit PurS [Pseudobdellovibrionaceae bacterium]